VLPVSFWRSSAPAELAAWQPSRCCNALLLSGSKEMCAASQTVSGDRRPQLIQYRFENLVLSSQPPFASG